MKSWGHTPKILGVFAIFGFDRALRQLRCSSEGAGVARRLFDGADTTGEILLTSTTLRLKAKAKRPLYLGNAATSGTIENVRARAPAPKRKLYVGT